MKKRAVVYLYDQGQAFAHMDCTIDSFNWESNFRPADAILFKQNGRSSVLEFRYGQCYKDRSTDTRP